MKIKREHYEHMRNAMRARAGGKFAELRQPYLDNGLSDKRFRWDLWRAAGLLQFTCDTLYKYLNDSHIDTALRAIIQELESEGCTHD